MVSCLSKDKLTRLTETSLKNKNMQPIVRRNAIVIGTYLSKPVTEYVYKVQGKLARITLVNPTTDESFATTQGLKKLIMGTDKQVYVTRGAVSQPNVSIARDAGLSFTELRSDGHSQSSALIGRWFNFGDEPVVEIQTEEQIQALLEGKQLACVS